MASLDYAFLADYAKVEPSGTLTAIGASFTYIDVSAVPAARMIAVAGRVRAKDDELVELDLRISGPGEGITIGAAMTLEPGPQARPYGEGRLGHLFAVNVQLPLPSEGLYTAEIKVGDEVRRLAFEVVVGEVQ